MVKKNGLPWSLNHTIGLQNFATNRDVSVPENSQTSINHHQKPQNEVNLDLISLIFDRIFFFFCLFEILTKNGQLQEKEFLWFVKK